MNIRKLLGFQEYQREVIVLSEKSPIGAIGFILILFLGIAVFLFSKDNFEQQKALGKGIETEAFVIDKKKDTSTAMIYTGQVMVPTNQDRYYLKLYALKNEFEISVSKGLYDQVKQGDYLAAMVYKDRIVLLQDGKIQK